MLRIQEKAAIVSGKIIRLPPGIYGTIARVTENTGLCDVNVIQGDNFQQAQQ